MKRLLGRAVIGLVCLLALAYAAWRLQKSPTMQLMGELVTRVETSDSLVALTFDDGPNKGLAEEIVAILSRKQVRATFFLVGSAIERYPEQARLLFDAGHELGNHSYSHERMVLRRLSTIEREVEETDRLIRSLGYQGPIHFRAPYGKRLLVLPYYLMKKDRPHVLWDVAPDSNPGVGDDSVRLVTHVVEHVRPGSIILLHPFFESRRESIEAVPAIIDELRARGYRFVTVTELLTRAATAGESGAADDVSTPRAN